MKKIGLLCLALVLALGTLGIGYATWSDNVTVEEQIFSGDLCVRFASCSTNDEGTGNDNTLGDIGCMNTHNVTMCNPADPYDLNEFEECELDKHVGSSNCTRLDRDGDLYTEVLVVDAYDIYPSYYGIVQYSICNCGTVPWAIDTIDVLINDVVVLTYADDWCKAIDLDEDTVPDLEIWWGDNFGLQIDERICKDMSFHWHLLQEAPQGEELEFKLRIHVVQWNKYVAPAP
jgi:hypothetical protein